MVLPISVPKIVVISISVFVIFLLGYRLSSHQQKSGKPEIAQADNTGIIAGGFDKAKDKTDEEWKKLLTSQQYYILREAGTETPFTGELDNEKRPGTYCSVGLWSATFSL